MKRAKEQDRITWQEAETILSVRVDRRYAFYANKDRTPIETMFSIKYGGYAPDSKVVIRCYYPEECYNCHGEGCQCCGGHGTTRNYLDNPYYSKETGCNPPEKPTS